MHSKEKACLVTGGAGFIGSHISELLCKEGYYVYILDNLSTGKLDNMTHLPIDQYEFVQGDIRNFELVRELAKKVQYIFHLAAYVSVPGSFKDPLLNNEINITGTLNILIAAQSYQVKKVVFSSSCAVYQEPEASQPVVSEKWPTNPLSPYGLSKKVGEDYAKILSGEENLSVAVLRYFNVFGPRQDPKSPYSAAIPIFLDRIHMNKPITIYGDGEQSRDFVYVKDVAMANYRAALSSDRFNLYNVGTGQSITITDLVHTLFDLTGKKVEVHYDEPRSNELKHIKADNSKLVNHLKMTPAYSLQSGLKDYLACTNT